MGIVYYGEYFHILERARNEYIRRLGMSYRDMEARGLCLPVREAQCRYRVPARYDDVILVRTAVREWGRASLEFVYETWSEDRSVLLNTAMTQHAIVTPEGRPMRMPDWFRALKDNAPREDS